jgi:hypothetical protein
MTTAQRLTHGDLVDRASVAGACLVVSVLAWGQVAPPADVGRIKALVEGGRFGEALIVVGQVEALVVDPRAGFELQFLKGAAAQQLANDRTQPPAIRADALTQAQAAYQRARQLRPESLATLYNLAALSASAGRVQEATDYYREVTTRAVGTRDANLETYAFNYAQFLKDRDGDEAIRLAEIAVKAPNSGAESRDLLSALYARYQPPRLLPFARVLLDEGRSAKVHELALVNIKVVELAPGVRRDWFCLLALTMARDALGQITYEAGPTLAKLSDFSANDPLAPAARQLVQAVKEPPATASPLSWWRESGQSDAVRLSPRASMRELLTSLGQHSSQAVPIQLALAERYFRTAIEFGERVPDPDAFLSLVDLYAENGRIEPIHELMNRYEYDLFSEKSEAYARGDWQLIFRLHTALGMTYAHLKVWRSPSPFQNAVFQLENAKKAADELNRRARSAAQPALYALPPAAVQNLSEGYAAVGRPQEAAAVRVDSAEALLAVGRSKESARLIKSINATDVGAMSAPTKTKYENLRLRPELG